MREQLGFAAEWLPTHDDLLGIRNRWPQHFVAKQNVEHTMLTF
jgi:hypothetical protein